MQRATLDLRATRVRRLKREHQDDADEFVGRFTDGGCHCHVSAPCSYCTHPGNPTGLAEYDEAWEDCVVLPEEPDEELLKAAVRAYNEAQHRVHYTWRAQEGAMLEAFKAMVQVCERREGGNEKSKTF